jgi:hypothetical protein
LPASIHPPSQAIFKVADNHQSKQTQEDNTANNYQKRFGAQRTRMKENSPLKLPRHNILQRLSRKIHRPVLMTPNICAAAKIITYPPVHEQKHLYAETRRDFRTRLIPP